MRRKKKRKFRMKASIIKNHKTNQKLRGEKKEEELRTEQKLIRMHEKKEKEN